MVVATPRSDCRGADNTSHLVKRLRLRPHEAAKTSGRPRCTSDLRRSRLKIQWHVTNFIEEPCECRRVHHESTLVHGCPVNRKTSQRTGAACARKILRLVDRRLQAVEVSAQQPSFCFS